MKHTLKVLCLCFIIFGLANCGSSGGGGQSAANPKQQVAGNADTITLTGSGSSTVEWSSLYANIYTDISSNGNCVTGLAQSADDTSVSESIVTLTNLLNQGSIVQGTGANNDVDGLPSVRIQYTDGSEKTYYLVDAFEVSADHQVLSNADEILDFYYEMGDELEDQGQRYCPGKGDNLPGA